MRAEAEPERTCTWGNGNQLHGWRSWVLKYHINAESCVDVHLRTVEQQGLLHVLLPPPLPTFSEDCASCPSPPDVRGWGLARIRNVSAPELAPDRSQMPGPHQIYKCDECGSRTTFNRLWIKLWHGQYGQHEQHGQHGQHGLLMAVIGGPHEDNLQLLLLPRKLPCKDDPDEHERVLYAFFVPIAALKLPSVDRSHPKLASFTNSEEDQKAALECVATTGSAVADSMARLLTRGLLRQKKQSTAWRETWKAYPDSRQGIAAKEANVSMAPGLHMSQAWPPFTYISEPLFRDNDEVERWRPASGHREWESSACDCDEINCSKSEGRAAIANLRERGIRHPLKIRDTGSKGWGVFSESHIPAETNFAEYTGELCCGDEVVAREGTYMVFGWHFTFGLCNRFEGPQKQWIIDATHLGNVSRFINHSCCPNTGVSSVCQGNTHAGGHDDEYMFLLLHTLRDIEPGEEITIKYELDSEVGMVNLETLPDHLRCKCGESCCRQYLNAPRDVPGGRASRRAPGVNKRLTKSSSAQQGLGATTGEARPPGKSSGQPGGGRGRGRGSRTLLIESTPVITDPAPNASQAQPASGSAGAQPAVTAPALESPAESTGEVAAFDSLRQRPTISGAWAQTHGQQAGAHAHGSQSGLSAGLAEPSSPGPCQVMEGEQGREAPYEAAANLEGQAPGGAGPTSIYYPPQPQSSVHAGPKCHKRKLDDALQD